ncbi:MAG TPA: hypothetical protein VFW71_11625 [Actinomycetota bacterium]|nr:hypothetical protein [Actinomycetota bacterium]
MATSPSTPAPALSPSPSPLSAVGPPPSLTVTTLPTGLPAALSREQVQPSGSNLLILGGLTGSTSSAAVQVFNPISDTVGPAGTLAVATHDAASAHLADGTDLLFGGGEATTIDTVQAFATTGGRTVGHLPQPRSDLEAATIAGKVYLLGGYNGQADQPDILETTDGVTFKLLTTLPLPVRYAGIGVVGNTIFLVGGEHNGAQTNAIQAVDVQAATATVISHLPVALSHESAFVLGGSLFVAGGRSGATTRFQVDAVSPHTGGLTRAGALTQPIADAGIGQLGQTVYLIGGETPAQLRTIVRISPVTG